MHRILSNIRLLLAFATIAIVVSFFVSIITHKWHWFGRSGSFVTMSGLLLSVRPFVRMGLAECLKSQRRIDLGHIVETQEEIEEARQEELDAIATKIGLCTALLGSIIWAYGDLIGGLP